MGFILYFHSFALSFHKIRLHSENKNEWGSFCIFTHLHYLCEEYCTLSQARRLNDK
ncbi:hypothetical protein HMPREF1146_2524 [Prevotella sp. MSX73]|nr:hypothetical protein HMPREF1146_2524 [Prevotella sp. MSX73]